MAQKIYLLDLEYSIEKDLRELDSEYFFADPFLFNPKSA